MLHQVKLNHIRLLLVGFSAVVREGLQGILKKDKRIELVESAADGQEALLYLNLAIEQGKPVDAVLIVSHSVEYDCVHEIKIIRDAYPEIYPLIITENFNDSIIIDAIHAGACGYILLDDLTQELLLSSIRGVLEGCTLMKTDLLRAAVDALLKSGHKTKEKCISETAHLTSREVDVFRLLGNGRSNKEIADSLGITLDTTKKHVKNVIEKLQARSRTHAAIIAAQSGIVDNPIATVASIQYGPRLAARESQSSKLLKN